MQQQNKIFFILDEASAHVARPDEFAILLQEIRSLTQTKRQVIVLSCCLSVFTVSNAEVSGSTAGYMESY